MWAVGGELYYVNVGWLTVQKGRISYNSGRYGVAMNPHTIYTRVEVIAMIWEKLNENKTICIIHLQEERKGIQTCPS